MPLAWPLGIAMETVTSVRCSSFTQPTRLGHNSGDAPAQEGYSLVGFPDGPKVIFSSGGLAAAMNHMYTATWPLCQLPLRTGGKSVTSCLRKGPRITHSSASERPVAMLSMQG